jgi:hypothetical protein
MRQSMVALVLVSAISAVAGGCTWVHMAPGASSVRVIDGSSAPAGCEKRGEVVVSVKDNVAFYHRNPLRVREELETLARNEAPGLQADTLQPLAEPADGEQRFAAWRCSAARAGTGGIVPTNGMAQTYPLGR